MIIRSRSDEVSTLGTTVLATWRCILILIGRERYEVFVKEIAKRIASDSGIVADIMELIAKSDGDRSTQPMANDAMPPATAQQLETASHV